MVADTDRVSVSFFTPEAVAFILLGAALLLWPLLATGGHPFMMVDSAIYADQGQRIWSFVQDLIARSVPVGDAAKSTSVNASSDVIEALRAESNAEDIVRSVPYAAFVGLLIPFGPVAVLYAQSVLVMTSFFAVLAQLLPQRPWGLLIPALALVMAASPAPTIASFLTPDIFGAVIVLFAISITLGLDGLDGISRIVLAGIAVLAVAFHYGNIPLALGLFCLAALLRSGRRRAVRALFGMAGGTVLIAIALNLAIGIAGFDTASIAPARAPILLARSIEDGPARWVLQEDCNSEAPRYALCDYWGADIPSNVGAALWEKDSMSAAPPAIYARIRDEEIDLLLDALRTYPLEQASAFVSNAFDQALAVDPRYAIASQFVIESNDRRGIQRLSETPLEGFLPVLGTLQETGYAIGVAGLLGVIFLSRDKTKRRVGIIVLAGLALNAAIFGGLSAPVARYQARVAWLALAVPALFLADWYVRRRDGSRTADASRE